MDTDREQRDMERKGAVESQWKHVSSWCMVSTEMGLVGHILYDKHGHKQ